MAPTQRSELVLLHRAGTGTSPARARDAAARSGPDETPITDPYVLRVALKFREVLDALGLDRSDPNLRGTEFRVARGYLELFAGLTPGNEPVLRTFPNSERYAAPVSTWVSRSIPRARTISSPSSGPRTSRICRESGWWACRSSPGWWSSSPGARSSRSG